MTSLRYHPLLLGVHLREPYALALVYIETDDGTLPITQR